MIRLSFYNIWTFENQEDAKTLVGPLNKYLKILEEHFGINLNFINGNLITEEKLDDQIITSLQLVLQVLTALINEKIKFNERDILYIVKYLAISESNDPVYEVIDFYHHKEIVLNTFEGRKIFAQTLNQKAYLKALNNGSVIFAIGSAGSGKTYLGVAYAISTLKKGLYKKIIITRPVVEAGEKLGFLPGDLKEKIDPYLVPIYDALEEFIGLENLNKMLEKGVIQIAPLAYMRGRTLDNAFIILDEAQNATRTQMKMFVTRLGFNSKMLITGDITQIDLPNRNNSGLIEAINLLQDIKGIEHIVFKKDDVMRHPLVSKIIERYEEKEHD